MTIRTYDTDGGGHVVELVINGSMYRKYTHPSRRCVGRLEFDINQVIGRYLKRNQSAQVKITAV